MYQQSVFLHMLKSEYSRYQNLLLKLTLHQSQLPEGYLCYRNGCYYRGIYSHGKRDQIPISQGIRDREVLIDELKERRFIKKALPILKII